MGVAGGGGACVPGAATRVAAAIATGTRGVASVRVLPRQPQGKS